MHKFIKSTGTALLAGVALTLNGCQLTGLGAAATATAGSPVVFTDNAAPSALVAVLNGGASGSALAGLVAATARPREDLAVLQAGLPPRPLLSSVSPAPPAVAVAGKPAAPAGNATSYQLAQYAAAKTWRSAVAAGREAEASRARAALSQWVQGLGLPAAAARLPNSPAGADNLAAESAAAAGAVVGLEQQDDGAFGGRRVIVLYAGNLAGRPPAGELTGDAVLVVTPSLPTSAASSAAQANLLEAGAAQAAVVGPEVTSAQLAALVSATLSQNGVTDSVSAPVLFANNSTALNESAVAQLSALVPRLLRPGVTAIVNGFASTTGSALANYDLSYGRADAVAAYLESHGVPASSLVIVGHGASDPVAPGASGSNRRVSIVIETS